MKRTPPSLLERPLNLACTPPSAPGKPEVRLCGHHGVSTFGAQPLTVIKCGRLEMAFAVFGGALDPQSPIWGKAKWQLNSQVARKQLATPSVPALLSLESDPWFEPQPHHQVF